MAKAAFQLVLQFSGDSLADFDRLVVLENRLTKAVGSEAIVDGHDIGSGEANIFILTDKPETTLKQCLPELEAAGCLSGVTAAFRKVGGGRYQVIWPPGSREPFRVS